MSIFGQVWLWSFAAFFVGVLLTWLVLVLPLRKSVRKLESSLAQAHADAARTPANAAGRATPGTEVFARPERRPEPRPEPAPSRQETSYPGTLVAPAPLNRDDVHDDIDEDFAELDSQVPPGSHPDSHDAFRPQPEPEGRASETQFLTPVAEPEDDDPYRSAASDYLAPEDEPAPATPALSRLEQQLDPEPAAGSLFRPPAEETRAPAPDWFDHAPPSERSAFEEPMERTRYLSVGGDQVGQDEEAAPEEARQYAFAGDDTGALGQLDAPPETPAEATQVLPKRQPREALRGGFETPQPIEPSMRTVERRETDLSGAHSGSLFE